MTEDKPFNVTVFVWNLPPDYNTLSRSEKKDYLREIDGFSRQPWYVRHDMVRENVSWFHKEAFRDVNSISSFWNVVQQHLLPDCGKSVLTGNRDYTIITLVAAAVILVVLSFLKLRKRLCLNFLKGRGAIVYPVDFITDHDRRWMYAVVFILLAYRTLDLAHGEPSIPMPLIWDKGRLKFKWLKVLVRIVNVLFVGFTYFPHFACLGLRRHILANICGILYLIPWATDTVKTAMHVFPRCLDLSTLDTDLEQDTLSEGLDVLMSDIPQIIAFLILLVCYVGDLIYNIWRLCTKKEKPVKRIRPLEEESYLKYVRYLLKRKPEPKPTTFLGKIKRKITYRSVKGFKYSARVACTVAMAAAALFFIVSKQLVYIAVREDKLNTFLKKVDPDNLGFRFGAVMLIYNLITEGGFDIDNALDTFDRLKSIVDLAFASVYVGIIVSIIVHCIFMIDMIIMYRVNLNKLLRGRNTFHYRKYLRTSPTSKLVSQMRYSGYQIAYFLAGYHLLMGFITLVTFVFGLFIILPLMDKSESWLIKLIKEEWPNIVAAIVIYLAQYLLVRFAFLQGRGRYLALNNRRWYHVASFFFLIYNVVLGIVSIIKRLAWSTIIGAFLLTRLDRVLLIKGFEKMDSGHKAYLGMLYVDLYHNHPVVRAFIQTLKEAVAEAKEARQVGEYKINMITAQNGDVEHVNLSSNNAVPKPRRMKKHVRNKWWKLVTLVNNPPLVLEKRIKEIYAERSIPDAEKMDMIEEKLDDGQTITVTKI